MKFLYAHSYYILILLPYMLIFSIVNANNLRLYEPSILDENEEGQVLPSIEYLTLDAWEELLEDTIIKKNIRMNQMGQHELWQVGLKG